MAGGSVGDALWGTGSTIQLFSKKFMAHTSGPRVDQLTERL